MITNADGTYSWVDPVIPLSGSSNEFLSTDSSGTISWIENKLPTFPTATKVLKFNQSSIYEWADEIELPSVAGGTKPYQALGSDGTSLSVVGVDTIASPSDSMGQILVYDADSTKQKWVDYDWALPDTFNRGDVLSVNDSGAETWIANTGIRKLSLGPDSTLGGVVFTISDDSTHALVAAFRDLNVDTILESSSLMIDTISWYEARDLVKDSSGYDEFGKEFSDWRLPTNIEFNELKANSDITLADAEGYWTSSQADDYKVNPMELKAIAYIFEDDDHKYKTELKSKGLFVRPVRLVRYR